MLSSFLSGVTTYEQLKGRMVAPEQRRKNLPWLLEEVRFGFFVESEILVMKINSTFALTFEARFPPRWIPRFWRSGAHSHSPHGQKVGRRLDCKVQCIGWVDCVVHCAQIGKKWANVSVLDKAHAFGTFFTQNGPD
jgi:hypothetical protein